MTPESAIPQPSRLPGVASAENGLVVLDGPLGVAVTMTIEAARETAQSLITAVSVAEQQLASGDEADA